MSDAPPSEHPRAERTGESWTASSGADGRARPSKDDSLGAFLRELPVLVIIAFLLAFLLRTFVVQVFYIPSSSMEPTLQVNDRILVDKVTYRFRDIHRGEVVVFEGDRIGVTDDDQGAIGRILRGFGQLIGVAPANARDFVKRVIGLPGDEVEIDEGGAVSVNGVTLAEPYVVNEDHRPFGPITVPEGQLFFLGDNRPNSSDSRIPEGVGFVDVGDVVGRAFLIIWPPDRLEVLHEPEYVPIPERPQAAAAEGRVVVPAA